MSPEVGLWISDNLGEFVSPGDELTHLDNFVKHRARSNSLLLEQHKFGALNIAYDNRRHLYMTLWNGDLIIQIF